MKFEKYADRLWYMFCSFTMLDVIVPADVSRWNVLISACFFVYLLEQHKTVVTINNFDKDNYVKKE